MSDNRPDTPLDQRLSEISNRWANDVDALASGAMLRDGLLKAAVNDLIWTIYHAMPHERYTLAEALEGMDEAVKSAAARDRG